MYKAGDRVTYGPRNHKAKIVRMLGNGDYQIEFDDQDLIPPQMDVPEAHLSVDLGGFIDLLDGWDDPSKKIGKVCPFCGGEWTETWIGFRPLYDCLKCNIKKEDV